MNECIQTFDKIYPNDKNTGTESERKPDLFHYNMYSNPDLQ